MREKIENKNLCVCQWCGKKFIQTKDNSIIHSAYKSEGIVMKKGNERKASLVIDRLGLDQYNFKIAHICAPGIYGLAHRIGIKII